MINKLLKRKWHIKPRIFVMLLPMLAIVFSSMFFAFNLFIRNYIKTNVETQLDDLVSGNGRHDDRRGDRPRDDYFLPDLTGQPKTKSVPAARFSLWIPATTSKNTTRTKALTSNCRSRPI